tara:strand:+ start:300 stop:464 length:165 start_codon:yes stop_codon:yes gene_type:complete
MMEHKELFEQWLITQFGPDHLRGLSFDVNNGYSSQTINAMWIGFNAGIELTNNL